MIRIPKSPFALVPMSCTATRRRMAVPTLWVAVLCLAAAAPIGAQTQTGTIEGSVKGPDGALLPGVAVTVAGPAVMGTRTTVSGESGLFRFPSLLPGEGYSIALALAGFQGKRYENLVVPVGQTTSLLVTLELEKIAGEVVVESRAPIVDFKSATASTHFDTDLLANIPNTQRDWGQTVLAAPGIVDGTNENFYGAMYSSRGGSVVANQAAVDGVVNTAPLHNISQGSGTVFESVQEVQVVSGALPAELGNVGGAYVNVVTKSGGNVVRGEAGIYYEDDSLQSDNVSDELAAQGIRAAKLTNFGDIGFDVGGPILKDKVWFDVGAARKEVGTEVSGFEFPDEKREKYFTGKVTWQASPNHTITGLSNFSDWDIPYTGANALIRPEATVRSEFNTRNYKVKWTGVLSPKLLAEVDLGIRDSDQANAPQSNAGPAYLDSSTGLIYGGNFTYFDIDYLRVLPKASLTWFEPNRLGSHQLKVGVEFERGSADIFRYSSGPLFFHLMAGSSPVLALFWNQADGVLSKYATRGAHFFAQDSWTVSPRVTLNLGMRVNTWKGTWPPQSNDGYSYGTAVNFAPASLTSTREAVSWSPVEPRLAASIALDESAKTVLRVGLSRYHHGLDMSYFQGGNPNGSALSIHPWVDSDNDKFADPAEVFAPISVQLSGGDASPVDPNLKNPHTDEVTIGIGRELFADTALTINATWRRDDHLVDDVSTSAAQNTYQPFPYPDPGVDGRSGTSDDTTITVFNQSTGLGRPNLLTVTNPPSAEREYKGVEIIFAKRLTNNWQALASLVRQSSTGTLQTNRNDASGISSAFNDPNTEINLSGPLVLDTPWQFKMMGTYVAPLGLSFSGYYLHQSGAPLYRTLMITLSQGPITIVADPRDTHREDSQSRLDLRVEKEFRFGSRPTNISIMFDVFNVLNEGAVTNRNEGTAGGAFRRPLSIQFPRTARFGARVRF